jgi:hypothetical protein
MLVAVAVVQTKTVIFLLVELAVVVLVVMVALILQLLVQQILVLAAGAADMTGAHQVVKPAARELLLLDTLRQRWHNGTLGRD